MKYDYFLVLVQNVFDPLSRTALPTYNVSFQVREGPTFLKGDYYFSLLTKVRSGSLQLLEFGSWERTRIVSSSDCFLQLLGATEDDIVLADPLRFS